jgi:hypothetical protein
MVMGGETGYVFDCVPGMVGGLAVGEASDLGVEVGFGVDVGVVELHAISNTAAAVAPMKTRMIRSLKATSSDTFS